MELKSKSTNSRLLHKEKFLLWRFPVGNKNQTSHCPKATWATMQYDHERWARGPRGAPRTGHAGEGDWNFEGRTYLPREQQWPLSLTRLTEGLTCWRTGGHYPTTETSSLEIRKFQITAAMLWAALQLSSTKSLTSVSQSIFICETGVVVTGLTELHCPKYSFSRSAFQYFTAPERGLLLQQR